MIYNYFKKNYMTKLFKWYEKDFSIIKKQRNHIFFDINYEINSFSLLDITFWNHDLENFKFLIDQGAKIDNIDIIFYVNIKSPKRPNAIEIVEALMKCNIYINIDQIWSLYDQKLIEQIYYREILMSFYYPTNTSSNLKTFLESSYCDPNLSIIIYSFLL